MFRTLSISTFLVVAIFASPLWAQSPVIKDATTQTMWKWEKAGVTDYVIIGTSLATALTARLIGPSPGRWNGGVLADESVRDVLLLPGRKAQLNMKGLSDVSLSLTTALPMLDATVLAIGVHRDPIAARQIAIINTEVIFVLGALQTVANSIASRERPYGRRCGSDLPDDLDDCRSRDRHYSFFSGHSAQSFGAAALTCSHHSAMNLYGGGAADVLQCVGGFSLAAFTATARIMADKHYLSDVVMGATVGTLTGFALPYFMRYRKRVDQKRAWRLLPTGNGLQIGGEF